MTNNDAEFIKCKDAGKRLYKKLSDAGIELTGVGVGLSTDKQSPAIHMMFKHKPKIAPPDKFEGYEVQVIVTGKIRALSNTE